VHQHVHDLRTRLAEAAEQAAQRARAPGAAVALRRARARRRRAAGTVCALVVVTVAAGIAVGRGGLEVPTVAPSTGHRDLPWRPLIAREWAATVPDEHPVDPVLAAAQGEQAGRPWRLTVYGSVHRPSRNARGEDVCYLLEWFHQVGRERQWRVHGTCAPEPQTTTALAAAGPDPASTAVLGRAPPAALRVRLELRGREPVETATVDTGGNLLGRFYLAFVPRDSSLERVAALDGEGREVAHAPGLGDLALAVTVSGYPPTGPVRVVARTSSRSGTLELVVWPTRYGYCLGLHGTQGGGSSSCAGADSTARLPGADVICGETRHRGEPPVRDLLASGGMPRATRTVRVEAAGKRLEVPATDAGEELDRAFFLAELALTRWPSSVRLTALDRRGASLGTWNLPGCG
jgi:hypothetical protein